MSSTSQEVRDGSILLTADTYALHQSEGKHSAALEAIIEPQQEREDGSSSASEYSIYTESWPSSYFRTDAHFLHQPLTVDGWALSEGLLDSGGLRESNERSDFRWRDTREHMNGNNSPSIPDAKRYFSNTKSGQNGLQKHINDMRH